MNYKIVFILLLSILQLQAQTDKKTSKAKKATTTKKATNAGATEMENPFVWHTDMNKAVALSNKLKKPMLLFFTGSDWCGWCIRRQKEVLKTPEFEAWAKKKVVLVELDFPRRTPQLPEIQKTVLLLRDYEGYDYFEIGEITQLTESQVKVYIFRARTFLKNYIGKIEAVI